MQWARALRRSSPPLLIGAVILVQLLFAGHATATTQVVFSTGNPDGLMAMASRPNSTETEAGDDFALVDQTNLTTATFAGLLPAAASASTISQVVVEIYRVFPQDSDVGRTTGAPTFGTTQVPTRVNSPSDVEFTDADSAVGTLSFTAAVTASNFTANNSVNTGIHPVPLQTTNGEGPVSGEEMGFNVSFDPPLILPAGHYFFVPQVALTSGNFFWLSAPKPIVAPGTPFPVGQTDLQAWMRNSGLEPDWLRVKTDIVGGSGYTFNGSFSVSGVSGCPAISVSPTSAPDAALGLPYSAAFFASGGTAPYTLAARGSLPPGLGFANNTLSGRPTSAGSFAFGLTATDSHGCTGTANVTLKVVGAGAPAARPALSSVRLSHRSFRAAAHGASLSRKRKVPVGTNVSYKDSLAAVTTFTVSRATKRHKRRRIRYVKVGSFKHSDKAGAVRVHFSGRVHGKKLRPGSYRLTLTPKLGGVSGKSVKLSFRVVRRVAATRALAASTSFPPKLPAAAQQVIENDWCRSSSYASARSARGLSKAARQNLAAAEKVAVAHPRGCRRAERSAPPAGEQVMTPGDCPTGALSLGRRAREEAAAAAARFEGRTMRPVVTGYFARIRQVRHQCGAGVARRTVIVNLSLTAMLPSASLSERDVAVSRLPGQGWQVWEVLH
jgi:hypothetical protein